MKESVTIKVNENLVMALMREMDPQLSRESGWWIAGIYNPRTFECIGYPQPGYGLTHWISLATAQQFKLLEVNDASTPLLDPKTV